MRLHHLARLYQAFDQLGADEQEVLLLIAERLVLGRKQYGALMIASDERDWHREVLEEVADGMVYAAIGLLKQRRRAAEEAA